MQSTSPYDGAAVLFGVGCIVHCIALPLFASALPFFAAAAEAEWVHWLLTTLSVTASLIAIASDRGARRARFLVPALAGMATLVFAVLAERFGVGETIPTLIGGFLLAGAHSVRLLSG